MGAISGIEYNWFYSSIYGFVNAVATIYDVVTFPVYLLIQNPIRNLSRAKMKRSTVIDQGDDYITIKTLKPPGEVHREVNKENLLTMAELFDYSVKKHREKRCLGTRIILGEEDELQPNGKLFKKYVLGDYQWLTFSDVDRLATQFGKGLRELGLEPQQPIAILAETRAKWLIAAHGAFKNSIPLVTIYATLGDEAIAHAINETQVHTVITSFALLPKFKNILKLTPNIRTIVYMEDQLETLNSKDGFREGVMIISFDEVVHKGGTSDIDPLGDGSSCPKTCHFDPLNPCPVCNEYFTAVPTHLAVFQNDISTGRIPVKYDSTPMYSTKTNNVIMERRPSPEDIAIIMYTSGSTGIPKGVKLLHRNLIESLKAFTDCTKMIKDEILMGYLPLAHVFELLIENGVLVMGIKIGYSSALTMIDTASKIKRGTKGDASILKPTFMCGVPLILDRIAKAITEKVQDSSGFKKVLFKFGYKYKNRWLRWGFKTPLIDRIIFKATKSIMGGDLRLMAIGGAPLTSNTHELIRTCLCIDALQGYGLTETCAAAANQDEFDLLYERVGPPMTTVIMRITNWEEGNYFITDKPNPRGEIIIGGGTVSPGYYNNDEKTKEDFFKDKDMWWFRTGDIGEILSDGSIKIIDRKKDLVKLQAGEYVSLGKVEASLATCSLLDNICIYADSTKSYCVGLVMANQNNVMKLAEEKLNITGRSFEELCDEPKVVQIVLQGIQEYAKKVKLQKFEIPEKIKLVKEVWSPENNLVTATFKLKRKELQKMYAQDIQELYK